MFGRQRDTIMQLGRIHSGVLEIARTVSEGKDSLAVVQVLAHLAAIERELNKLITETESAHRI